MPTAPSEVSGVASSAQGLLQRITDLPLEDVVESAVTLLANINAIVTDERVRAAPENLGLLLADVRELVNEAGIQQAPAELAAILASVRELVDQATQAQLVANLSEVLTGAKAAVASVGTAADGVPELLDEIQALSAQARALPLDELVASGTRLVDNIDAFVQSQGVANLPGSVNSSLAELRGLVNDLRAGGAVENVNATLASVRQVSDELARAQLGAEPGDHARRRRAWRWATSAPPPRGCRSSSPSSRRCRRRRAPCRSRRWSPPPGACSTGSTPSSPARASPPCPASSTPR